MAEEALKQALDEPSIVVDGQQLDLTPVGVVAPAQAPDEPHDIESESDEEPPKPKVKKPRSHKPARLSEGATKKKPQQQPKKKAPVVKKVSAAAAAADEEPNRRQPGHAMLKAENDRLNRALDALVRKRVQREDANNGKAPTSVCGVLLDNIIEFYEDKLEEFNRKFGKYL
jgi:hypothetical protein